MTTKKPRPEVAAAYEAMKAAEADFHAERTPEARAAYKAANEAYNAIAPRKPVFGHSSRSGKRQLQERLAAVAEAQRRKWR